MTIKKRNKKAVLAATTEAPVDKLVIVTGPKQELPSDGKIDQMFGEGYSPSQLRRFGMIALDCGEDRADAKLNAKDIVALLRTPYDKNDLQEIRYRNRIKNRATAITAMCVVCKGSRKAVTECMSIDCPLWLFRLGGNPFHKSNVKKWQ